MEASHLACVVALALAAPALATATEVFTFDCSTEEWYLPNSGSTLSHTLGGPGSDEGRLVISPVAPGESVITRNRLRRASGTVNNGLDGTVNNQFALRVEAPWLGVGESLPLTIVSYQPGPTAVYFNSGNLSITGPEPQTIRAQFAGGFLNLNNAFLDIRFGGAGSPVGGDILVDWMALTADPAFEPVQDAAGCNEGAFYTFDCDLDGFTNNPNLSAEWQDRDGGKAIVRLLANNNAQFNPPGMPVTVDVTQTPWLTISQKVTGTGAPEASVGMLVNTSSQGFANFFVTYSELEPSVQLNLAAAFSGTIQITEVRMIQTGAPGINRPATELEIDYFGFTAARGGHPVAQDTEECPAPVVLGWPTQAVRIPGASPAPVIDGQVGFLEWAPTGQAVPTVLRDSTIGILDPYYTEFTHNGTRIGSLDSDADISAHIFYLWDDNALYVAAQVFDDALATSSGATVNSGDSFWVAIDYDQTESANPTAAGSGVYQLVWGGQANSNDPDAFRSYWPVVAPNPFTGAEWAVASTPDGYSVEARIPWTAFSSGGDYAFTRTFPPTAGQLAGLNMLLIDEDTAPGFPSDAQLHTSGGGASVVVNAALYEWLVFVDAPVAPTSVSDWMAHD